MTASARSRSRSKDRSLDREKLVRNGHENGNGATQDLPISISVLNSSCAGGFGALIETPLTAALLLQDPAVPKALMRAWRSYGGLLVLRGLTDMTPLQFETVSSIFGEVETELDDSKRMYQVDGVASVMRLGNTRDATGKLTAVFAKDAPLPENGSCQYREKDRKPVWHTDQTYRKSPPIGSLLYCKQAPPQGAATCFADMRSAYADLGAETKQRLEGMECICSLTHHDNKVRTWAPDYPVPSAEQRAANPAVRVPILLVHSVTNLPALYGMNASTCQIVARGTHVSQEEMDKHELEAFEDPSVQREWRRLLPQVTSSKYTVVWQWQPGDLVVWDNRCTIHCATGFDDRTYLREMWRTTLAADSNLRSRAGKTPP